MLDKKCFNNDLNVTKNTLNNIDFSWIHFLIIQHILSDTFNFIDLLKKSNWTIWKIYAKPFSIDKKYYEKFTDLGYNIEKADYQKFEETNYLHQEILNYCESIKDKSDKIILLDVWGYFSKALSNCNDKIIYDKVLWVTEVTTLWYNKYNLLKNKIDFPIYSIAKSRIKEHEAHFVWKSSYLALEQIFMQLWKTLYRREVLVIGYWMIWKNNALILKNNWSNISVYDSNESINIDWYNSWDKYELLKNNWIIFSATANQSLSYDDILNHCKDWVYLVSTWSKWNEFDIKSIKEKSISNRQIHNHIIEYTLENSKKINVVKNWEAINFLVWWTPDEIIDMVLAEYSITINKILSWNADLNVINELSEQDHIHIESLFDKYRI